MRSKLGPPCVPDVYHKSWTLRFAAKLRLGGKARGKGKSRRSGRDEVVWPAVGERRWAGALPFPATFLNYHHVRRMSQSYSLSVATLWIESEDRGIPCRNSKMAYPLCEFVCLPPIIDRSLNNWEIMCFDSTRWLFFEKFIIAHIIAVESMIFRFV